MELAETLRILINFNDDNELYGDNDDDFSEGTEPLTEEMKNSRLSLDMPKEEEEEEEEKQEESLEMNKDLMIKLRPTFIDVVEFKRKKVKTDTIVQYPEKGGFSDMMSPKASNLATANPPLNTATAKGGTNTKEESSFRLIIFIVLCVTLLILLLNV